MPHKSGINFRVTAHCSQGGREYMEDMITVGYSPISDHSPPEYWFLGVFDGHGGSQAAEYAKKHLIKNIVSQPGFLSSSDMDVCQAIKDGFLNTHYAMWDDLDIWPKKPSGLPNTSGTTASVAFIRNGKAYIGHVGDSRIVLGKQDEDPNASDQWTACLLTEDHKPESPAELQRITACGGKVVVKSEIHTYVTTSFGQRTIRTAHFIHIYEPPRLAMTRALGDFWSHNPASDEFVISPIPDVTVVEIDPTKDRCLIFGTDGLFDVLTPQTAVNIVEWAERNNKQTNGHNKRSSWKNPSRCLVDNAITWWDIFRTRADNISAIVLLIDPPGPQHARACTDNPTAPWRHASRSLAAVKKK